MGEGGLQWGPGGWGGVTCWVPAATELTPPVSPVTGGRHHVSPEASLRDGWAPFLGPASRSPPGRDSPGAAGAWGLFLCSLEGGRAGGQQRAEAGQPGSQFRSGGGATASGPAPKGPAGPCERGWFLLGVVGNVSSSAPARAGGHQGGEVFLHSMEKVGGAQMREVRASG